MEATDDYIKSAVENEISRMLAKNAANTGKSGASETVGGCEIKKEPEEVMEQDTSLQDSDNDMETTEDENIQVENACTNKYSVKVVTKYMCRYCARQFDSPDEMQEHIASHARGKCTYHACYVCGKTYSTPSKLQRHVRVHSGERPYACNICGRRFTRSDHVKQHLKVHMPQKQRNTCRLCGQKFLRRQTLHSHLQQAHSVSTVYTCHRCGEAFDEITKLHSHKNSHVSIYGKNDGPEVEGGMVIKQEAGENGENDTPIIGLAKFSLGPQPAPDDLVKQVSAAQMGNMSQNGYTYKSEGYYTTETHRLAVVSQKTVDKPTHNKPQTTTTAVYSCPMSSFDACRPLVPEEDVVKDSNTVSDGMNMFILPSDIKKERESPDNSFNESNEEIYKSDNCQSSYFDDIAAEENESHDATDVGQKSSELMDDEKLVEKAVQNLLTGPPGENKGIKMKLFGPASYKAAMRNKIAMKVPTPRLRQMQNPMVKASATGNVVMSSLSAEKGYTTITKPESEAANFSPYIVGGGSGAGVTAKTQSPVQVTLSKEKEKKLSKCEHCCIWFEDYTMCLLHNSLHSADENDPFTCRKCLKKLGNRLEFTAHLVWHLEPNMQ